MARRERTTALPRARRRERADTRPRFLGIPIDDATVRLGILGGAAALLAIVLGLIGWHWYSETFRRPNEVVLTVGSDEVKLKYYSDRMVEFYQANPETPAALNAENLLSKLEEEALSIQLARDLGISMTGDDVTAGIAKALGVPVGGPGSSFDTLYRNRLKTTKMSDANYRKMTTAAVAGDKLLEYFTKAVGDRGETITLRSILVDSQEKADALLLRIKAGEDMGTLAQVESADLTSRQQDGVMVPISPELLPEAILTAISGKGEGELLGPVQVQGYWWLIRIEKRDPNGAYGDADKQQLAQKKLDDAITTKRSQTTIKRSLDASAIDWATNHAK